MKIHFLLKDQRLSIMGLIAGILLTIIPNAHAQVGIDIGPPDTAACGGTGLSIFAQYDYLSEPNVLDISNYVPTSVPLTDDLYTNVIDIGFDFEFFGNTYNQCLASSNNYVTFDLANAGGYSPWAINNALPNPGSPLNAIMSPWQDTNPGIEGTISYVTVGTAPNRAFIYSFLEVSMFSCTDLCFINQVIIYETTNIIEIYLGSKPSCPGWNDGAAILGLHNATGTEAVIPAGYNFPNVWTALEEAWQFVPDGNGSYTFNQIPFEPAGLPVDATWYEVGNPTPLGVGTAQTFNITTTTEIYAEFASACSGNTYSDTITITIGNTQMSVDSISPSCIGFDNGAIVVDPTGSTYPVTVAVASAAAPGTPIQSMSNVSGVVTLGGTLGSGIVAGDYVASVTDAVGCITEINITVIDPPALTFTATPTDATCFGYDDGYIIVNQDGMAVPPLTFVADSGGFATQITGVNLMDTLEGLPANDYTVTMIDANNCPGIPVNAIVDHPTDLVPNADHIDILCYGETNAKAWAFPSGSVGPYQLQWDDEFEQTSDTAEWLGADTYTVTVTDAHNCVADTQIVVIQPPLLELILTGESDTCGQKPTFMKAQMTGGVPPYSYNWSHSNNPERFYVDTFNFFAYDSAVYTGEYGILVLDSNNCEVTGEITIPLIPKPKAAFNTRSKPEEIIDPFALFANNSELATSYHWEFGDGYESYQENPEHEFRDTSGVFLVKLTAFNDPQYGCWDEAWQYVDVKPYFTFYVPSAFTPDGDDLNDEFGPMGNHFDYETYRMTIYDRWGSEVFMTDNPEKWWDGNMRRTGKPVKDGVYIYVFEIKKFNIFEPKIIKGTVTVHRQHQPVE